MTGRAVTMNIAGQKQETTERVQQAKSGKEKHERSCNDQAALIKAELKLTVMRPVSGYSHGHSTYRQPRPQ